MFDDFMHNDLPDMHFHQPHQDAMLHAQGQAINQAVRAQQAADVGRPAQSQATGPAPHAPGQQNAAMNVGLFIQTVLEHLVRFRA